MSVLSEQGVARREAGLEALKGVVRARGRRRVVGRVVAAAAVLLAVGVGVWMQWPRPMVGEVVPRIAEGGVSDEGAATEVRVTTVSLAGVGVVRTDRGILAQVTTGPEGPVMRLNDEGLVSALREAGEPTGIVRIGKRVMTEGDFQGKGDAGI